MIHRAHHIVLPGREGNNKMQTISKILILCAAFTYAADDEKIILTPKPGPAPHINGPRLFGARPGRPFIYRIPCTGDRPITFTVVNLPEGLTVNEKTGIIAGQVPDTPGRYVVDFIAHNMVSSGMADFGYTYINIDDCWMRIEADYFERVKDRFNGFDMRGLVGELRGETGNILPNANFLDMKRMTDYIHEISWDQLDIRGSYRVRDLWRQRDIGEMDGHLSASVGRHGVLLIRLWPMNVEGE